MSISFAGFSAWFAPELHSYRSTWLKFGGEEKELAEADIAFVTEKTPSGGASYKPTLKILRPDWIEDSVRGQKRLSLKRYKTVFPALRKFDSREYSNMAVGVDAYNSTNTISLESSWQLHQPESELQDLSVTPSSGGVSYKPSTTQVSITKRRTSAPFQQSRSATATLTTKRRSITTTLGSTPRSITSTPGSVPHSIVITPRSVPRSVAVTPGSVRTLALSQSDSEEVDEGEGDDDDDDSEYKEDDELAEEHNQENEPAVAHSRTFARPSRLGRKSMTQEPLLNSNMESIEVLEESDSLVTTSEMPEATTHTAITKKRRLPRSLERSKRESARTHNSQVSDDFFASSDDDVDVVKSSEQKRVASSQRSVDRADTVPLSSRESISSSTFNSLEDYQPRRTQEHVVSLQKAHYIRAGDYLRDTLARMDEGSKQLLLTKPPGVRLIDIRNENIDLQKKRA